MTRLGKRLYFSADDGEHGYELWVTDGTRKGTKLLRDIREGGSSNARVFTRFGKRLYFAADDGVHDFELWVTDGTKKGTKLFADINPAGPAVFCSG